MRLRLTTIMTAALLLVPVAAVSASMSPAPRPEKKCPSLNFILHHCD